MWPRTRGGKTASLPCRWDSTINITRTCLNDGRWNEPAYDVCNLLIPRVNIRESVDSLCRDDADMLVNMNAVTQHMCDVSCELCKFECFLDEHVCDIIGRDQ